MVAENFPGSIDEQSDIRELYYFLFFIFLNRSVCLESANDRASRERENLTIDIRKKKLDL